jgi:acid phosphatase (class A)
MARPRERGKNSLDLRQYTFAPNAGIPKLPPMKIHLATGLAIRAVIAMLPVAVPSRAQDNIMKAASGAAVAAHFVSPQAFDLTRILPAPPPVGSLAAKAELEVVLQAQAWRTAEQIAWAKTVEKQTVFTIYGSEYGAWFTPENLPQLVALLKDLTEDLRPVSDAAKKLHPRARPYAIDSRVQPCVEAPLNDTYPSGHALTSYLTAAVLAEISPEHNSALNDRARRAAWGRVIGGVHFPTDLEGGRLLAEAAIGELRKSAAFRAAIGKCRVEMAAAAMKKAA